VYNTSGFIITEPPVTRRIDWGGRSLDSGLLRAGNTNAGQGLATNQIRVWDAEGNSVYLEIQLQKPGATDWLNVSLVSIDGLAAGLVSAYPTGLTHQVVWNAAKDLGAPFTNSILLRARARDITLTGNWSDPVSPLSEMWTYPGISDHALFCQ
jgi:hypothetical protein